MDGGKRANKTGKATEAAVQGFIEGNGRKVNKQVWTPEAFAGKRVRADLVVPTWGRKGLAIECKWQDSPGSAYQKLFWLVEMIGAVYPWDTLIVCGGEQLTPEVIAVVEEKKHSVGNFLGCLRIEQFFTWGLKNL
jgi:hypothetical protein